MGHKSLEALDSRGLCIIICYSIIFWLKLFQHFKRHWTCFFKFSFGIVSNRGLTLEIISCSHANFKLLIVSGSPYSHPYWPIQSVTRNFNFKTETKPWRLYSSISPEIGIPFTRSVMNIQSVLPIPDNFLRPSKSSCLIFYLSLSFLSFQLLTWFWSLSRQDVYR